VKRQCHLIVAVLALVIAGARPAGAQTSPAIDAARGPLETINAAVSTGDGLLTIQAAGAGRASGVHFRPASDAWDWSAYAAVSIELHNPGSSPITVRARAENPGAEGMTDACESAIVLLPGQRDEMLLRLVRRPEDPGYEVFRQFYMYTERIDVRANTVDPAKLVRLTIRMDAPQAGQKLQVGQIRLVGEGKPAPVPFFPFVDEFGQYIHSDWPGKVYSNEDFARLRDQEAREYEHLPGPADWNEYGGWANGPRLKATGHFYATKHDGKWWLVDPSGSLFWSHGPTGVGYGGDISPITDREHWFEKLPLRDDPLFGRFYRRGKGATYRYYQERQWVGFDFAAANLLRKYGEDYRQKVAALSHQRMRSWGFNTIGNWSDSEIYEMRRTPYVVAIHYGAPLIHYRMPDVYDPAWEPAVRARMEKERGRTSEDPWNIGYFIDNERWWGWRPRAAAIGEETLKNPPERHAKIEFIRQLREKYGNIARLNEAWGTQHASWEALASHREAPDMKNPKVLEDCGDFGMRFAERYFSVCRDAVKSVAPNIMYLGVRFHGHIDKEVVRLASKYCDVISYNIYDNPPHGRVNQYNELDLPIMSTEWGIDSDPQQTPFRGKDKNVQTPQQRAQMIVKYLESAIRHPNMVGAHFFQYRDQPISGRPDGEAVLRGFVNITDTPNFELIQTNRRIADRLYQMRAGSGSQ